MPTRSARSVRSSSHDYPAPLELFVIVRGVWRLHAPWGGPDDDVVIDAPADDHQRNQDQDEAGHLNACDDGVMSPIPATMATTPKTFSAVRRTDLSYPRATQLRGRLPAIGFSEHANEHRPKGPVLLAVDQELGEGAGGGVPPVRANPLGAVEGRVHQDAEQPGAWSAAQASRRLGPPSEVI
jgi:hypothetical protein